MEVLSSAAGTSQCVPFEPFEPRDIEQSIPSRFAAQVARHAQRIAIATPAGRLSYQALNARANRIANMLIEHLGRSSEPVAFLAPQSAAAIATTLGILKAGKCYVPLDPGWGDAQLHQVIGQSGARLVLVTPALAARVADCERLLIGDAETPFADADPQARVSADAPAYIYYTSGTTGRPKGVVDSHRNVLHNVMRYSNALRVTPQDRLSLVQSCGFSGAVSSMFTALLNGACACPLELRDTTPAKLADWIEQVGITIYHSVPAIFRSFLQGDRRFPGVRVVRLEGDQASRRDLELFQQHFVAGAQVAVGLGTTETGLVCQYFFAHGDDLPEQLVPIGYPVADMAFVVADEQGRAVSRGASGEIVVRSAYLASGYWQDEQRTAQAFTSTDAGERQYRTGDLGRMRADGCLEYLGRRDARVKVRGLWVDLADVEAALQRIEGVRECVVVLRADDGAQARLVAYYVADPAGAPGPATLREQLTRVLPAHAVPAAYIALDALPLNANCKVDREALPAPSRDRPPLAAPYAPARSLVEVKLVQIWESLLGVRPIGIRDEFTDLGGDSLLAVEMLDRIEASFEHPLSPNALLGGATIEHLAHAIVNGTDRSGAAIQVVQSSGSRPPLFFFHGDYLSGGLYCNELARSFSAQRPFYALPPSGMDGGAMPASYADIARAQLTSIRAMRPRGPYLLAGYCNGGVVAYEIARLLHAEGEEVPGLVLLGTAATGIRMRWLDAVSRALARALRATPQRERYAFRRMREFLQHQQDKPLWERVTHVVAKAPVLHDEVRRLMRSSKAASSSLVAATVDPASTDDLRAQVSAAYKRIDMEYVPSDYPGSVQLLWPQADPMPAEQVLADWLRVAPRATLRTVPGNHITAVTRHAAAIAAALNESLARV